MQLEVGYHLVLSWIYWVKRSYLETSRRRSIRDTLGVLSKSKGLGPTLVPEVNESRRTKNQLKSWSSRLETGSGLARPRTGWIHLSLRLSGFQH